MPSLSNPMTSKSIHAIGVSSLFSLLSSLFPLLSFSSLFSLVPPLFLSLLSACVCSHLGPADDGNTLSALGTLTQIALEEGCQSDQGRGGGVEEESRSGIDRTVGNEFMWCHVMCGGPL
jgi:hypothetical protein